MLDIDIEDSVGRVGRLKNDEEFLFNVRTSRKKKIEEKIMDKSGLDSVLPWNFAVFLRTWGCSHNNSDSEYMAGQLAKAGFGLTSEKEAADIWLLNSCTVKTPSENQLENQIREAISRQKKVVVAGCVSQAAPNTPWLREVSIVGVEQIDKIVSVVEETLKGNNVRLLSKRGKGIERTEAMINLPKMRRNEFIEILAINSGCLNHCTYCKTKAARGDLRSIPPELLLAQAKRALTEEGCRELWLTSEDLGAWGRDIGLTIPDLLQQLVEIIPEGCMMRLGMTNPPYILDHLEEIAQILRHPRVYSFLHIPVQSGSDAVLSDMKREYSKEHFCRIVDYMMENVPNVYIATDFICAFPTETEADFEESLELIRRYKFPSIFINQFYPRPGTPAARLKKVNTIEARRRTSQMTHLFHSYRRYEDCRIGERHFVLICELASDGKHYVGHNKFYEHILVPNEDGSNSLLGKWSNVQIVEVSKFYMRSKLIEMPTKMDEIMENEQLEITKNSQINEKKEENGLRKDKFPLIKAAIVGLILFLLFKFLLLAFL